MKSLKSKIQYQVRDQIDSQVDSQVHWYPKFRIIIVESAKVRIKVRDEMRKVWLEIEDEIAKK